MKKILCMLLALLLLASLGTVAFADGWQEVFEENGFTLTFTDAFRPENLKGIFSARAAGKIDDGLYYAEFLYMGISEEELSVILEKEEDEISEADKELIRSKQGTLAVVYGIDYSKISEENLAIQKSIADRVTELATAGDVVFYRYNIEDYEETAEFLAGIAPAYREEYRTLQADFNEALKTAEFYTPINRAEQLVGNVISFETTDLDGTPVRSEHIFKEHEITIVNLWATCCHNCVDEMAALREILEQYNVNYLNLMPFEGLDDVFMWNGALPTSYFISSDGTVQCPGFRGAPQTMDPYEEIINGLLTGETVQMEEPDTPHIAANDEGAYRVIVSDTDGNLVKDVKVQFCSDTLCSLGTTDENGVAVFQMEEGQTYTVHILKVPAGYEKHTQEYKTADTYCDVYISLDKAA